MVKRNLAECVYVLSPGRDKTSHSYETVTQVEGKVIKEPIMKNLIFNFILFLFPLSEHSDSLLSLQFIMRGPSSFWVPSKTG